MRTNQRRCHCLGISLLGMLILSPVLMGQDSRKFEGSLPVTSDWSQHHIIVSKPATAAQARLAARAPRYQLQLQRQVQARFAETEIGGMPADLQSRIDNIRRSRNHGVEGLWSEDMGTGATVGAVNYPAKISFASNVLSCANDFVVYGTGLTGAAGQAGIVAYSNLYTGCGGAVPSAYWAYNTDGGTVTTSPMFSADGTQLTFTQDEAGAGNIVLLKWAASDGTVGAPDSLARTRSSAYFTCAAPCMTSFTLRNAGGTAQPDSNSSVFYDYEDDTAYVGDDGGWLHQFTPVFRGVPIEVRTGGWPVQVNPGSPTPLTSPVHDYGSGNIFVTDVGGFLYRVTPGAGVTVSGQLDFSFTEAGAPGLVQGPIVDSSAGLVYVFAPSDGSGSCAGADCAAVYQLAAGFGSGNAGSKVKVGNSTPGGDPPNPLYIGAFDINYENSGNATGNLYVCGNTGGAPILYQVPITAGTLGTALQGPTIANTPTPCSPVTDVMNPNASGGATERLFASEQTEGVSSACANGCIFSFNDTAWEAGTGYAVGQEVLDTNLRIEVVSVAGTSGGTVPHWNAAAGGATTDGTVHWLDQGLLTGPVLTGWTALHHYTKGTEILDPANNIELVTSGGPDLSGVTIPSFNPTAGGTTTDATITWTNVGAIASAALAASGGTSGIVIDNILGSGIEAGDSQIYFSTLSDQTCTTSGGAGGCAVQASQAALQ
jgi:hypothetical protein